MKFNNILSLFKDLFHVIVINTSIENISNNILYV